MVKAIIDINDHTNQILNIVKAKFGLNDKSQAIEAMAVQYESEILEPQLRPQFIEKMKRVSKEDSIKVGNVRNFKQRYGVD